MSKKSTSCSANNSTKSDAALVGELQIEAQDIEEKGFLRDAQRTENLKVAIPRQPVIKDFNGMFASFGSCFAQNLQKWLTNYGFKFWFERDICAHYSTESMATLVEGVANRPGHSRDELYYYADKRGGFNAYRYQFKKRFFGISGENQAFARMAELDGLCANMLQQSEYLVATLGTARVLRLRNNNALINTALGIPETDWSTEMLSVEDNVRQLERFYSAVLRLRGGQPPVLFLTISPQRYLFSQTSATVAISPFVDNTLGKSILRVAVEEFMARHPNDPILYFPAFEIVTEELRQYETLSTYDFMHINQDLTPKYVVKRFLQAYAANSVLAQLPLIEKARLLLEHRANLASGGLNITEDTLFAQEVLGLMEKTKAIGHLETMSPSLIGPLADLINGCGNAFK